MFESFEYWWNIFGEFSSNNLLQKQNWHVWVSVGGSGATWGSSGVNPMSFLTRSVMVFEHMFAFYLVDPGSNPGVMWEHFEHIWNFREARHVTRGEEGWVGRHVEWRVHPLLKTVSLSRNCGTHWTRESWRKHRADQLRAQPLCSPFVLGTTQAKGPIGS